MVTAFIASLALVLCAVFDVRLIRHINEEHALAGRFGATEQERVLTRRIPGTLRAVERLLQEDQSDS